MNRTELKEIIQRIIRKVQAEPKAPRPACLYGDTPPGPTTKYGIGEES